MRLILVLVLTMLGLTTAPAAAQTGTPVAGSAGAVSCSDVKPRDAAFFRSVAAAPAEQASPEATFATTPTPFAMPAGEPEGMATVAEITTLYERLVACLNAGDYLRAYALYSDDYLLRNLSDEAIARLAATPAPVAASQQSSFGGVLDARIMDDGKIGALLTVHNPQSGEVILFSIMHREGGRLLIDDERVVEAQVPLATPQGTPAT